MTVSPLSPSSDVTEQIARLLWMLCQIVTERCSLRARTLTAAQVGYVVARLLAARKRFRGVIALIRAGRPPKARTRKPRERAVTPKPAPPPPLDMTTGLRPPKGWQRWAREDRARARQAAREQAALERAAAAEKPVPPWRSLRQHLSGWLCGFAPTIAEFRGSAPACADQLRALLAEPEMRALLMAHRSVGDSLRRVCWALGVERSLLYPAPIAAAAPVAAISEPVPGGAEISAMTPAAPAGAEIVPASLSETARYGTNHSGVATVAPAAPAADIVAPTCPAFNWLSKNNEMVDTG